MTRPESPEVEHSSTTDPRIERSRRVVREAALAELAESGYGAFAIDSVSARCGVARSTIYRHWPDKLALIADALQSLNRQPPPADGPADETPRQRIHRLLRHLATVFQGSLISACLPALIEGAERHDEVATFLHRFSAERRRALVDAIARAVATGEVSDHVDPDLAATALSGAIMYRRLMTGSPFDPADVADLIRSVLGDPPPGPARGTERHSS